MIVDGHQLMDNKIADNLKFILKVSISLGLEIK